ncbi:hypothetical protein WOLCODRAFT_19414 [Wolfiporia cocos MD-104 SS10]|uniref:DUF6589 domain-containing protein n=1 Tax=Wolfiporia cocos (strain MD-104) TaxID=742152 RepID=A0A2H3IX29_WOLCO|nr:hypothetical protein WOLCODRAFT_19414 [Wolfiporia cocos MD-104 SS10]
MSHVVEQRADSKDHFDNGTMAILLPLYDILYRSLHLSLEPERKSRLLTPDFSPSDLLPTALQVQRLEAAQLWHIEDIFFNHFLDLHRHLGDSIPPPPNIQMILLHKTEQFPLPAIHIDKSSLDSTINVMEMIFYKTLQLSEDDIRRHSIILCGGNQLSVSLLDKYTMGQIGLFHVKIAADCMIADKYWGSANSQSPWSLWKVNTLLGHKPILAGWKANKLPPFRPTWKLILQLSLPKNILDIFCIYCPNDSLEAVTDFLATY